MVCMLDFSPDLVIYIHKEQVGIIGMQILAMHILKNICK